MNYGQEGEVMKSKLIAGLVLAAGTLLAGPRFSAGVVMGGGQRYDGSAYYATARPPCPGPGYYWVEGYWFRDRGYRAWRPGYWAAPRYSAPPQYYNGYRDRDRDRREDRRDDRRRDDRREDRGYRR
jgi:hypothetical protein